MTKTTDVLKLGFLYNPNKCKYIWDPISDINSKVTLINALADTVENLLCKVC